MIFQHYNSPKNTVAVTSCVAISLGIKNQGMKSVVACTRIPQILVEENLGKFGKSLVIHQILTISRDINKESKQQEFAKVYLSKLSYGKCAKDFLCQTFALYSMH